MQAVFVSDDPERRHGSIAFHVLDLPTLIEVKPKAGHPQDKIARPLLLATLDERSRRQ